MKYRLKHIIEYSVLRSIGEIFNILPYRAALLVGAGGAWFAFHICRFRVKETKRRIRLVFGKRFSEKEISRIAWISWRNIVFNGVEVLRISKATPGWVAAHYEDNLLMTKVKEHTDTGKGGIIATPHMGNWDLASVPACQNKLPVFSIAAQQRNPLVNDYFNRIRSSPGFETLTRGRTTMKSVVDNMNQGKLLVILPDSRMRTPDIEIPFLNGKANLGKGTAFFARKTNLPIFLGICTRIGWSRHKIQYFEPIWPDNKLDKNEDIKRMTTLVVDLIDKAIQDQPEQWFWYNKRWVLDPIETEVNKTNLGKFGQD